ncbi:coiled-coil-helix-coiled-coil-helix domain containing 6b isoform X5 [Astyanax mexicanus]|uniref:coiled-coil-helix-coiled-coil-helix domain containing 6b isoform X5 n=1 Tax=Astyanax mexicanus TaxID=7994 RepID=UPI0020CAB988|nr:coiled-coil-helix-coiled-coil-helix domain containing 6b isoform X5 [Astyanax mexicanus]
MGGRESTTRKVSYGLDQEEKVTVLQGVKLSDDVLQRMRESGSQSSEKSPPPKPGSQKTDPGPTRPSPAEMQEELRKRFEREQGLVREELARMARREKEAGADDLKPAVLRERARTREELEKAQNLPAELNAWNCRNCRNLACLRLACALLALFILIISFLFFLCLLQRSICAGWLCKVASVPLRYILLHTSTAHNVPRFLLPCNWYSDL